MTKASDKPASEPVSDPRRDGNEDPVARAQRLGQGDVVDPNVPTGQTPEQMNEEIPAHDSNEQLHIAAEKRAAATDEDRRDGRSDERGFTQR